MIRAAVRGCSRRWFGGAGILPAGFSFDASSKTTGGTPAPQKPTVEIFGVTERRGIRRLICVPGEIIRAD